jgi:DNA invertase Pin-like site-specific DNA recombinase
MNGDDRFYRHLKGLLMALDTLRECNVTFVSVQEKIDLSTPWGKLTLTVLGMLAEIYIDNLRYETRKGKIARARKGLWNGTPKVSRWATATGCARRAPTPTARTTAPSTVGPTARTAATW